MKFTKQHWVLQRQILFMSRLVRAEDIKAESVDYNLTWRHGEQVAMALLPRVPASLCPPANDTQSYWRTKVVRLPVRCSRLFKVARCHLLAPRLKEKEKKENQWTALSCKAGDAFARRPCLLFVYTVVLNQNMGEL